MLRLSLLLLAMSQQSLIDAREITFPSISGYASQHVIPQGYNEPDITQAKYAGLTTYANLPYVHCLAPEDHDVEPFDIAILGAPFDTVGRALHRFQAHSMASGGFLYRAETLDRA